MSVNPRQLALGRRLWTSVTVRALATTSATNALLVALGTVGGLLIARHLGAQGRGGLVAIQQWPIFLAHLCSLGFNEAGAYFVAKDRARARLYVGLGALALLASGLIGTCVGAFLLPRFFDDAEVAGLVAVSGAFCLAYVQTGFLTAVLLGDSLRAWNVARLVQPALYAGALAVLAISGQMTLRTATFVVIASQLAQLMFVVLIVKRRFGFRLPDRKGAGERLSVLTSFGLRSLVAGTSHLVNARLDLLVLTAMPSVAFTEVGIYAVAVSISGLVVPAGVAVGSVGFRTRAQANRTDVRLESKFLGIGVLVLVGLAVVIGVLAPTMIPWLFGPEFVSSVGLLTLLLPAAGALAFSKIVGDLLRAQARPGQSAIAEGLAAALTVSLLLVLVPRYGVEGAALTSLIAYSFAAAWGTASLLGGRRHIKSLKSRKRGDLLP